MAIIDAETMKVVDSDFLEPTDAELQALIDAKGEKIIYMDPQDLTAKELRERSEYLEMIEEIESGEFDGTPAPGVGPGGQKTLNISGTPPGGRLQRKDRSDIKRTIQERGGKPRSGRTSHGKPHSGESADHAKERASKLRSIQDLTLNQQRLKRENEELAREISGQKKSSGRPQRNIPQRDRPSLSQGSQKVAKQFTGSHYKEDSLIVEKGGFSQKSSGKGGTYMNETSYINWDTIKEQTFPILAEGAKGGGGYLLVQYTSGTIFPRSGEILKGVFETIVGIGGVYTSDAFGNRLLKTASYGAIIAGLARLGREAGRTMVS